MRCNNNAVFAAVSGYSASDVCSAIGGFILAAVRVLSTRQNARPFPPGILTKALDADPPEDDARDYREVVR